jgi:hypothetical protein
VRCVKSRTEGPLVTYPVRTALPTGLLLLATEARHRIEPAIARARSVADGEKASSCGSTWTGAAGTSARNTLTKDSQGRESADPLSIASWQTREGSLEPLSSDSIACLARSLT